MSQLMHCAPCTHSFSLIVMYFNFEQHISGKPKTKLRFLSLPNKSIHHDLIPLFTSIDQVLRERGEGSIFEECNELVLTVLNSLPVTDR